MCPVLERNSPWWKDKNRTGRRRNKKRKRNKFNNNNKYRKKKKQKVCQKNRHSYLLKKISPYSVGFDTVIGISREEYTCLKSAVLYICNSHSGSTPNLFEDHYSKTLWGEKNNVTGNLFRQDFYFCFI